jgi:hypothetical protein
LPELVGPGRPLVERGHLDPERSRGLVRRRPGLALLIEGGRELGDLLGAGVERDLGMLGGVLGAVQVARQPLVFRGRRFSSALV